jgi:hypothetical protein
VNRGTLGDNASTKPIIAATPTRVTKGMLQEPQEDAFVNAQALLDNWEGKHVDNGTVNFSLSERDCNGMMQRRKEPSVKDTWNTMQNTWEEIPNGVNLLPPTILTRSKAFKEKRMSSIAKKTSACGGSNNCNNRNSHIG